MLYVSSAKSTQKVCQINLLSVSTWIGTVDLVQKRQDNEDISSL